MTDDLPAVILATVLLVVVAFLWNNSVQRDRTLNRIMECTQDFYDDHPHIQMSQREVWDICEAQITQGN